MSDTFAWMIPTFFWIHGMFGSRDRRTTGKKFIETGFSVGRWDLNRPEKKGPITLPALQRRSVGATLYVLPMDTDTKLR